MTFTAEDLKELRERSGCGMHDCKHALEQCLSLDHAERYLRTRFLAVLIKCSCGTPIDKENEVCPACGARHLVYSTDEERDVMNNTVAEGLLNMLMEMAAEPDHVLGVIDLSAPIEETPDAASSE